MGKLIDDLRACNSKLRIELDTDNCIQASNCDYGKSYDFSVVFNHDKGEIEYGTNTPSIREHLDLDSKDFEELTYQGKRVKFLEAREPDFDVDKDCIDEWADELPWVKLDGEGEVDQLTNTEDRMNKWLDGPVVDGVDGFCIVDVIDQVSPETENLPGFEIYDSISDKERIETGMKTRDLGGPVSEVLAVKVGNVGKLKELLLKYDLPFYFDEKLLI